MNVGAGLRVRVWVTDVWDSVTLEATPDWSVARLKEEALQAAMQRPLDPSDYLVKYRGAQVFDESLTLQAVQAPDGAPFIILPASRQPVR